MSEATITQRRSQRLFIHMPVIVEVRLPNGSLHSETTHTIVVNAHGALVEMSKMPQVGQSIVLQNAKTNDRIECIVKLVTPADGQKCNVGLEFTKPNPGFWHISFPPEDWSMHHPDAKRNG